MNCEALVTLQQHLLESLAAVPAETRRLFHGRGRVWPGLEQVTVDWMQGVLLVSLFKQPTDDELAALTALLRALPDTAQWQHSQARSLLLHHRYLPQSSMELLAGETVDDWVITENGLRYKVDFGKKQNSGLFLDMRYGRDWVRAQAGGKRILNLFAYTCGFSVAAIAGGADHVVNLDMARAALNRGRENHHLNGHDLGRVSFLGHDLFKSWAKVTRMGPYDMIIIDPPSFQKGSFMLDKDYQRVLRRLPELLEKDGLVLACLNDPATGADFLIEHTRVEAPDLRFECRLDNPPEFPDAREDGGLKALVFSYEGESQSGWA
jgi:23S rRNA (cytosine1962-C5)-methyltransferase